MTAKQLKVSCFLFFLLFLKIPAQVNWKTMEEVIALQKIKPKKIIIDFYTNWCVPCKLMDSNTYNHPIITKLINEDYYAVKINAEGNEAIQFQGRQFSNPKFNNSKNKEKNTQHEFARFFNIYAYPSLMFMDENFQPITNVKGFVSAKEIEPYFQMIVNNDYLKIKTKEQWEDYQRHFKSKIIN